MKSKAKLTHTYTHLLNTGLFIFVIEENKESTLVFRRSAQHLLEDICFTDKALSSDCNYPLCVDLPDDYFKELREL